MADQVTSVNADLNTMYAAPVPPPHPASETAVDGPGLSQMERVVDTFVAPSKTFLDIRRSASWWLPFLLGLVVTYIWVAAIQSKVGWSQVVENTIHQSSPEAQAKMAEAGPAAMDMQVKFTAGSFYVAPVFGFIGSCVIALGLWLTINFGAGGKATFWKVFAVLQYAWLPQLFKPLISSITLFAGASAEDFNLKNPVGTNLGYYLSSDSPAWLRAAGSSLDVFVIWSMVLLAIGLATVAYRKRSTGYIVVFGWWLVITLISVGFAAAQG